MADKIEARIEKLRADLRERPHATNGYHLSTWKTFTDDMRALAQGEPGEADMPAICAALGFDPTNHHNAAKCPYCTPQRVHTASAPAAEREPTINLKGHEFKASDLLRRGVLNLRKGRSEFFWPVVSTSFGLGSTCAAALAVWAGRDPDTGAGIGTKEPAP